MARLHIEHPISAVSTWLEAFHRFADARERAGVRTATVGRPVGRDDYIVVDLEFATTEEAERFLAFLRTTVWASPARSPALQGEPRTMVLDDVPVLDPRPGQS